MKNALHFGHQLLAECLAEGDVAVDATAGNGYDTLFLAELVAPTGKVVAFDIQAQAIQQTQQKLADSPYQPIVHCIHASHAQLDQFITAECAIKAAVFNLGYLPGSDKSIITHASSTITALKQIMARLTSHGRIILIVYHGHLGGADELNALEIFLQELDQKQWSVLKYHFINQKQAPPICFCLEKKH